MNSYGFSDVGSAIAGVTNLFFFFLLATSFIKFIIDLFVYSKRNFFTNLLISLLTGVVSGILTGSIAFLSLILGYKLGSLIEYIVLFCFVAVLVVPLITMRMIKPWYQQGDQSKFIYGSAVFVSHAITMFILYRLMFIYFTSQTLFGPGGY